MPFWPLDPGWVKNLDPGSGSGVNNPNHISESLETVFWVKILKFLDADPGSGMENIRKGDLRYTSRILITVSGYLLLLVLRDK
jgi:hypothetical protein